MNMLLMFIENVDSTSAYSTSAYRDGLYHFIE